MLERSSNMGKPFPSITRRRAPGSPASGRGGGRMVAGLSAAVVLGVGSAVWATTSASAAPAAAVVPRCAAADLAVWVNEEAVNGAAGTAYYPLEFTNTSGHA